MAWGKKKVLVAVASEDTRDPSELKWARTVSNHEIDSMFRSYYKRMNRFVVNRAVNFILERGDDGFYDIKGDLGNLNKMWKRLKRNQLPDSSAGELYDVMAELTKIMDTFFLLLVDYGPYHAYTATDTVTREYNSSVQYRLTDLRQRMNKVYNTQWNPKDHLPGVGLKSAFTGMVDDADIADLLKRMGKLWERAKQRTTDVEEVFFLEEAAQSYIPDTVRLYKGFAHAGNTQRSEAKRLVIDQLKLIERQLADMAKATDVGNMDALQANGEFLKSKF